MFHIKFTSKPFDKLSTDCAVVTSFEDSCPLQGNAALLDWRMNGRLSRILIGKRFTGAFKELILFPSEGRVKSHEVMVVGLGSSNAFNESHISELTTFLLKTLNEKKIADFSISFSDIIQDRFEWRNTVRMLVSKLYDYSSLKNVKLCEPEDRIRDARKRHMDFGINVEVSYET